MGVLWEKFTFDSAVWGNHEKLQADQELGNEADKFAVKVVKTTK